MSRKTVEAPVDRLLALLSAKDYGRLRPHLTRAPLTYRQSLYEANKPLDAVYFIETGVGSLVNTMSNGQAAEVGTIGNEGVVGLPIVLATHRRRRVFMCRFRAQASACQQRASRRNWRQAPPCEQ